MDFTLPKDQDFLTGPQKKFLDKSLRLDPARAVTVRQIHGSKIISVDEKNMGQCYVLGEADGLVTKVPNLTLTIRTADCLPIFLFDAKHQCISLVHAGWRGTSEKIVQKAVARMREEAGTEVQDLQIALGPAIGVCCYRVGREFTGFFPDDVVSKEDGLYFNLPQANVRQLKDLGMNARQISDGAVCTCCHENYFSYRRQGEKAGRMMSLLMLRG